jgi:hypothetical protein
MADTQQLGIEALNKQPLYYMDMAMAWEQRLALAYDEATMWLKKATPPGTTIDTSRFEAASSVATSHVNTYGDAWMSKFKVGSDLDQNSALVMSGDYSEAYYLGKYAQASANLGAYLSGYAREQIPIGAISQAEFDQGAEMRLRALSEVIYLGRTGALPAVVAPDVYAKSIGGSTSGKITVATPGITFDAAAPTGGLGCGPACIYISLAVVAGLVAVAITVSVLWTKASQENRQVMLEVCQDAVRRGNPNAPTICADMSKVVAEMASPGQMPNPIDALIPKALQTQIVTYGAIGLGLYTLIMFAPQIMASLGRTKDVLAARQVERMAANRRRVLTRNPWMGVSR